MRQSPMWRISSKNNTFRMSIRVREAACDGLRENLHKLVAGCGMQRNIKRTSDFEKQRGSKGLGCDSILEMRMKIKYSIREI